jgi:NAD+ synthetase
MLDDVPHCSIRHLPFGIAPGPPLQSLAMRIALAQINPTIGDIDANASLVRDAIDGARQQGAKLVVFPELTVIGYPPKDLLLKPAAVERSVRAVEQLAEHCTGIAAIIGYPSPSDSKRGRSLYNAAALCGGGKIQRRYVKTLLPTYDVFDESRYFEPGPAEAPTEFAGEMLGVTICEDLWNEADIVERQLYHIDPIDRAVEAGATLLINSSASPFVVGKHAFRRRLFAHVAKQHRVPVLYCNQVGGNDELIFDGNSCAFNANGELIAHGKAFAEDLVIVDLPGTPMQCAPRADIAAVYDALVLGLRDYCRKCGFTSIVLGLSGGIDSAVTAALCIAALGSENVRGVTMPSRYSSGGSMDDAKQLAANMNVRFDIVPIAGPHDAFEVALAPLFEGLEPGVAEENVQARVRGVILMALSNKFGSLLVTTGNKSELAVGYCTLYGDMAGGLAALSDVPKTMVWELARWINDAPDSPLRQQFGKAVIPDSSITKPPSAELRPDQTDQDSLPDYGVLDQIIERYVEQEQSARQIIADMPRVDAATIQRIVRLIDLNEYKRKQAAPGLKVTGRAFGFGRRMPIAQRYNG